MSETIRWTSAGLENIRGKNNIPLGPKEIKSAASNIILTGKGLMDFGQLQQENFIRLLENFASESQPATPTIGQLWFKPSTSTLYMCVDVATSPSAFYQNNGYGWLKVNSSAASDISALLGYTPIQSVTVNTTDTSGVLTMTTGTVTPKISIAQSTSTTNGYLSATDWSKFNAKQNATTANAPISLSVGASPVISISQSSSTTNGYLSSTDWSTFNGKQNATTVSSPLSITVGASPVISITKATSTTNGYLSSTDWATFNGKLNAGGGTMSAPLYLSADPVANLEAATKQYVDTKAAAATTTVAVNDASSTWYNLMGTSQVSGSVAQALVSTQFKVQPSTGYLHATNIDVTNISSYSIQVNNQLKIADGSATAPAIAFISDGAQDTGFYWGGDGYINFASNGQYVGQIRPGGTLAVASTLTAPTVSGTTISGTNGSFGTSLTAPTQANTDNSTNVATTAFVKNVIAASTSSAPMPTTTAGIGQFVYIAGVIPAGGTWAYYQMDIADDGNVVDARGGAGIAAGGTVLNYNGAGGGQGGHYGWAWRIA